MTRGGDVNATTIRRTRDEGSIKEGKDGKGDSNATVLAAMDGATVMVIDGNDDDGWQSSAAA
jgi:hypothetical protein